MILRIVSLSLFAIAFIIAPFSEAQTIQSDVRSLSKGADIILSGKVINQKSEWTKNKSSIYTQVTLSVNEYLKGGNNQATFSFSHPGGEVDGVGELYTHIPRFQNEEEVLLFIKKNKKTSQYNVFNGESGKINLIRDPASGELKTTANKKLSVLKAEIKKSAVE